MSVPRWPFTPDGRARRWFAPGAPSIVTALLLATVAIGLPAATQAATAKWAWVVVRQSTGDSVPGRLDRGNSKGGENFVTDLSGLFGPGVYGVGLADVGPAPGEHGSVLVSTFGTLNRICTPDRWETTNDDVSIIVACFTRNGVPAPATFVLNWLAASGTGGRLAYAQDWSPTSNCGSPRWQYLSQGGSMESCPVDGLARVIIPTVGLPGGTVQVTAMSTRRDTEPDVSAGFCSVASFGASTGGTVTIDTACFEPDGRQQIYRQFNVWYMYGLGMKGAVRRNVAYLFANKPQVASYTPDAPYRYSSSDGVPTVRRVGTGRYLVTLPGMPIGGSAQVTAHASRAADGSPIPRHCVISSIRTDGLPQQVGVRCFDVAGTLADSRFLLAYAR